MVRKLGELGQGAGIWRRKAFSEETKGRSWVRGGVP